MRKLIFLIVIFSFLLVGTIFPKTTNAIVKDVEEQSILNKIKANLILDGKKECLNSSTAMPLPELFQNIDRIVVYLSHSIDENHPLFPTQKWMEENTLSILRSDFGSCVSPDKISFTNSVDDPAFQKNSTLGVYVRVAYKQHIKTLYMTSFLYRHERTDFISRIGESHYWQKSEIRIEDEDTAEKSLTDFLRGIGYTK